MMRWLAALVLLSGCVGMEAQPSENTMPPAHYVDAGRALWTAGKVEIFFYSEEVVRQICLYEDPFTPPPERDGIVVACAIKMIPQFGGGWVIFTSSRERWVIDHEMAHVGGWNDQHGN